MNSTGTALVAAFVTALVLAFALPDIGTGSRTAPAPSMAKTTGQVTASTH